MAQDKLTALLNRMRNPALLGAAGKIFYVDGTVGSDNNPPDDPTKPLLKIATALSLCKAGRDDVIVVIDCWQQDTFPITIGVDRVHILGLDADNGKYPRMEPPGDTAIFLINAEYFEIAGFSLGAGANKGCIEWAGSKGRGIIRKCWFGRTGSAKYGLRVVAAIDPPEMIIEDCLFGSGITDDGISIEHNMTRGIIQRNLFRVGAVGIHVDNTMALGEILDNRFVCSADVDGRAITLDATCTDGVFIDRNSAHIGDTLMANNPYLDSAAAGSNHWGVNYQGNTLVLPA